MALSSTFIFFKEPEERMVGLPVLAGGEAA
jgi:hypothetical protein